jgi:hypothetical protein
VFLVWMLMRCRVCECPIDMDCHRRQRNKNEPSPPPPPLDSNFGDVNLSEVGTFSFLSMAVIIVTATMCYPHPIHFHAGSAPEGRRMVLEFLASQTLLDVHNAIVQMTEDDVWTSQKDTIDSGCFFIEDQFYSTGTTDYTGPIIRWIDGGGPPNPARRGYLGIAATNPFTDVKPMKEATLNEIPFRLGIRYCHVTHGDVECCFSITDTRLVHPATVPYPIIHDIWTPSYPLTLCDACERFAATYVYHHRGSAAEDYQDGEPKALCDNCCDQLKLLEKEKSSLQLYAVWKRKSELSVGMIRADKIRFF